MKQVGNSKFEIEMTDDFKPESCWLACSEWFLYYAVKDKSKVVFCRLLLNENGSEYTCDSSGFSCIEDVPNYFQFQFWLSEKTLILAAYPCNGLLHKLRLHKGKAQYTRISQDNIYSALCVDLFNNVTWALPTTTNEGRVSQYSNAGG